MSTYIIHVHNAIMYTESSLFQYKILLQLEHKYYSWMKDVISCGHLLECNLKVNWRLLCNCQAEREGPLEFSHIHPQKYFEPAF